MHLPQEGGCLFAEPLEPGLNGQGFYSENQFLKAIGFPFLPFPYPLLDGSQGFFLSAHQLISPLQREAVEEEELGGKLDPEITDAFSWAP